jgi:Raf kinase inhibitor-like YbhB/YbcL family protein
VLIWAGCGSSSSDKPPTDAGANGTGGSGGATGGTGGTGGSGGGGSGGSGGMAPAPDARAVDAPAPDAAPTADGPSSESPPAAGGPLVLTSPDFKEGDPIPMAYKCPPQANTSPPLSWTPGPPGTKSYAVSLQRNAAIHWQLWDIPEGTTTLSKDVPKEAMPAAPAGSKQSKPNLEGFTSFGYFGPCPHSPAVASYPFKVYALKVATLGLTPQATTADVAKAIAANTLATAVLTITSHD